MNHKDNCLKAPNRQNFIKGSYLIMYGSFSLSNRYLSRFVQTNRYMNSFRLFFLAFFLLISGITRAQQTSFVYMQTENNLPYKVFWNGNTYPSSITGYLVIPQVPPGIHPMVVAFSAGISPDYTFIIPVADKPRGFSLRQSVDNNWSLFDMIDFSLIKGVLADKTPKPEPETKITTETIVQVIPETKPEMKEPAKPVEKPAVFNETPVVKKEVPVPVKQRLVSTAGIMKIFEKAGSAGIDQVYIIVNGVKSDTVALFIPDLKEELPKPQSASQTASISQSSDQGVQVRFSLIAVSVPQRTRKSLFSK